MAKTIMEKCEKAHLVGDVRDGEMVFRKVSGHFAEQLKRGLNQDVSSRERGHEYLSIVTFHHVTLMPE